MMQDISRGRNTCFTAYSWLLRDLYYTSQSLDMPLYMRIANELYLKKIDCYDLMAYEFSKTSGMKEWIVRTTLNLLPWNI
jgi:hypothetical protein